MPIKLRTMTWLLVLILIVPGLAFGERRGRLNGKVVDPEGKGISGVLVTVTSPQVSGFKDIETTDKKGVFTVDFTVIDVTYHYRFDKAGFQSMETEQLWGVEGSDRFQWTMQPGTAAVVNTSAGTAPVSTSAEAIIAYNAGITAFKAKDYATAETKLKESVGLDPKLRQAWGVLSAAQVELGHNKEAVEAAEKAMALGSTDEAVLLSRWQAYKNLKDDVKAAEALKDLDRIGRRTEEAKKSHNDAVALLKAGKNDEAFAKFQEALSMDPNLQVSLIGLATVALKLQPPKYAEAATAAETILKADPKNEKAIRIRYNACLSLGDQARLSEALFGLAPYEPAAARQGLLKLAYDAYDANDMPAAKERFGKVLQLDPSYAQAYYVLGLINVGLGDNAEAKRNFERFLQLAPNDKEAPSARDAIKYLGKS